MALMENSQRTKDKSAPAPMPNLALRADLAPPVGFEPTKPGFEGQVASNRHRGEIYSY